MEPEKLFAALALVPNMRTARFDDVEVTEWSGGFKFEGHAAVFDEEADLGLFTESVERGAFRKVLARLTETRSGVIPNVPLVYEHDRSVPPLATTRGGTLRLSEDAKGLFVDADVADTSLGRDVHVLAKRGDVRDMSYGFLAGQGNQTFERRSGSDKPHRRLTNFKHLLDVSLTFAGVYASAEAQFRSLAMQHADSPESLQQLLQGMHPQLGDGAVDLGAEAEPAEHEDDASGVSEEPTAEERSQLALAARKRRFALMTIRLPQE